MQSKPQIITLSHFSPAQIADSGQCFRMKNIDAETVSVLAGNRHITVRTLGEDRFAFDCGKQAFETFWRGYFDLDPAYDTYVKNVPPSDSYMQQAIKAGKGLRILRQDPWETLITFLLSQRKAIPLIKRSVELMCERFGDPIGDGLYAFPTPEQLASADVDALAACGLGYRTKYVAKTAELAAKGELCLDELAALSDEQLKKQLMALYGVGVKVASCVMLFGYHRLDLVPVDVWMDRVAKEHYGGTFPYAGAGSYAGVLQQYVFEYIREEYGRK